MSEEQQTSDQTEQGANTGSMGSPSGDADASRQFRGWGQEHQGGPASTNDEEAWQTGASSSQTQRADQASGQQSEEPPRWGQHGPEPEQPETDTFYTDHMGPGSEESAGLKKA